MFDLSCVVCGARNRLLVSSTTFDWLISCSNCEAEWWWHDSETLIALEKSSDEVEVEHEEV